MGSSSSKSEKNEALLLCKERMRFIKQAIGSRYALSAAHLSYIQSLRSIGIALRRFAEAEVLIESSLSTSEPEKTPSHSSYASPSPSRIPEHVGSPSHSGSPFSPRLSNMSYMRTAGNAAVTVRVNSSSNHFVEEESLTFPLPPPPPPPESFSSWDFFYPVDSLDNAGFQNGENSPSPNFSRLMGLRQFKEDEVVPFTEEEVRWNKSGLEGISEYSGNSVMHNNVGGKTANANPSSANMTCSEKFTDKAQPQNGSVLNSHCGGANGSAEALARIASSELCKSKRENAELDKELCTEREDASEFITHRAKDFLSSIKDIENRFLRAAESGNEVSRMLETNKIRLGFCSERIGKPHSSIFLSACHLACCNRETALEHESSQHVTKVITWNRSTSSLSSSSKNPLATASKDDICDSGSDFIEEFCMISGSHSSTLDRLFAWERKLYDEVKASESIRNLYDQKCTQLRHQFARDLNTQVIDKTRAIVKDLHSRVRVVIQAVDSISKRIEKLRDEELQPQLVELIQGLIRMWKAVLECHHAQYITISLAYHVKSSTAVPQSESYKLALSNLQTEIDCFGTSFVNWVDAHRSYIEALNTWLQKCILLPKEHSKRRKVVFSPHRALAPPIFVLCHDWLAGIKSLPSEEVCDSLKTTLSDLHDLFEKQVQEKQIEKRPEEQDDDKEMEHKESKEVENSGDGLNLGNLQTSLTRIFDRLTKFSEASLKMYEDVKQGTETARIAYTNGRIRL